MNLNRDGRQDGGKFRGHRERAHLPDDARLEVVDSPPQPIAPSQIPAMPSCGRPFLARKFDQGMPK
jgi:hypothetical protein